MDILCKIYTLTYVPWMFMFSKTGSKMFPFFFTDLDNSNSESEALSENGEKTVTQQNTFSNPLLNGENASISSIETLLLNIQGLLKVAAENARHHERQLSYEKGW